MLGGYTTRRIKCDDCRRDTTCETEHIGVYIQATHGCCENRVKLHNSLTQTTVLRGQFKTNPDLHKEFIDNVKLQQSSLTQVMKWHKEITKTHIEQVKKKQFANIVNKLSGKSLTTAEQKILDEQSETVTTSSLLDQEAVVRTSDLVDFLGLSATRISELAKDGVMVKKEYGRYLFHDSVKNYIRMLQKGRKSKHGSSMTMEELRQRLLNEQGRKEQAIASLRKLELKMKAESLIPEEEAVEVVMKL